MTTESSPKVSVIVPIYKTPLNYFKECMDSLYNQTMQDAEFILVFDGENRELLSICNAYNEKDERFKIFIQSHLGVSATRNFGIKQARGEYIAFVDADDSLYSNIVLNQNTKKILNLKSDIVIFDWFFNNKKMHLWNEDKKKLTNEEKLFCIQQIISIQKPNFSGAPWAKFFKRIFILQNRIYFKSSCSIGQDRVFNLEAFINANNISYFHTIFYSYSTNIFSATQKFRPNYLPEALSYIEELNNISKNKFPDLIGRETIIMFYRSWEKCYMNKENNENLIARMSKLTKITKSYRFQHLIKKIKIDNFSFIMKIESFLLQHKCSFWIFLHGIKSTLMK